MLAFADEKGETSQGCDESGGGGKRLLEFLYGTHGDQGGADGERLCTQVEDAKSGEIEGAAYLAKKGRFLAVAFDQGDLKLWCPILEGQTRESGAAADVEQRVLGLPGAELAGGKERFAKVTHDDLFGRAKGSEVHALVPAEKQ